MKVSLVIILFFCMTCHSNKPGTKNNSIDIRSKIQFDLNQFDSDGLYGPEDGKRAMDYEFCVPSDEQSIEIVKKIDPSIQIHQIAKGRIQCGKQQSLCIGNTHQNRFKEILLELASLDFVEKIVPTYFE